MTRSQRKQKAARWKKGLTALALAGVLAYGLLFALVASGARDELRGEPQIMVILGCQVMEWGPSVLLQDRLDRALEYLEEHPGLTVVVSGGQGTNEPVSEAAAMAAYLEARGVPGAQILLEDQSRNTMENLNFTFALLVEKGYDLSDGVVVVSNGFHLTRSVLLARRAGFEEISCLAAPSSNPIARLHMNLREPVALLKSFLLDR